MKTSVLLLACLLAFTGCSRQSAVDQQAAHERQMLAPLKAKYPTVLMGFDFKGQTLLASIDMNGLVDQDEDTENAMRTETVAAWRRVYAQTHPGVKPHTTVQFVDFNGRTQFTGTAKP